MGLPGAGPICSRLGTGPFLTARFSGPIFLDFGNLFWSRLVSILEHFWIIFRSSRSLTVCARSRKSARITVVFLVVRGVPCVGLAGRGKVVFIDDEPAAGEQAR